MFLRLVARDLVTAGSRAGAGLLPLAFFLLVAMLFPFAVGADAALLERIAPGIVWVAALLAALLPIDRLIEPDRADGTLDQLVTRGLALETVAAARTLSHWLALALPLIAATPFAAAMLGLPAAALPRLLLGLAIGTPALAALGVTAAALTAGARGAGALAGLLVLPLAVPVLIFGAGWAGEGGSTAPKLLAASSLLIVAVAPFASAAGMRAALD